MIENFIKCLDRNKFVYLIGNGGSASTCSHFANDLVTRGYKAICLADNVENITRIANDKGYEYVFVDQLKVFFSVGDILVTISASGNSPNLLKAVEYANKLGTTVSIVGFDGGKLAKICHIVIHTETNKGEYGYAEDKHLAVCHSIAEKL